MMAAVWNQLMLDINTYSEIYNWLQQRKVTLIAVSKTRTIEEILSLYKLGHRDFGENYVQELIEKQKDLPADIRWHFIGHLQKNKVKFLAPFIYLIHSVDHLKLLEEINRQGEKTQRVISCLLQVHLAQEETKFGLTVDELKKLMNEVGVKQQAGDYTHIQVKGLMGMASFTDRKDKIKSEFHELKELFMQYSVSETEFSDLSMGMSSDYTIAVDEGSNMVRIGSLIFGERKAV